MKLIYRCLCMVLGAILGTGCSSENSTTDPVEYGPMPEYGVPTGTVHVTGRVLDNEGTPIEGVKVSLSYAHLDTTDAGGNWSIEQDHAFIPCVDGGSQDCTVLATDIDGPVNGGPYPPVDVVLDLEQTEPGSGSYDLGTWEQHGVDVVMSLTKKESSAEEDSP